MKAHSHVGVVRDTVTLVFENGYSLTFTAGSEVALHVVESAQHGVQLTGETCRICGKVKEKHVPGGHKFIPFASN